MFGVSGADGLFGLGLRFGPMIGLANLSLRQSLATGSKILVAQRHIFPVNAPTLSPHSVCGARRPEVLVCFQSLKLVITPKTRNGLKTTLNPSPLIPLSANEIGGRARACRKKTMDAAETDFGFSRGASDEHTPHGPVRSEQRRLNTKDAPQ